MKKTVLIILLILPFSGYSQQEKLPFHEIGNYPEEYSETNLISRMIEGLGYRYYWATESLNEKDLIYKASIDSRTTFEIIEHIYKLSLMIASSFKNEKIDFNSEKFSYTELRERTLNNFNFIFESLKNTSYLSALKIQFDRPPLLPVLIAISYKIFGVGHFSAHLPNLISSIFVLYFTYKI